MGWAVPALPALFVLVCYYLARVWDERNYRIWKKEQEEQADRDRAWSFLTTEDQEWFQEQYERAGVCNDNNR